MEDQNEVQVITVDDNTYDTVARIVDDAPGDPFKKSAEELRDFRGLSKAAKQRMSRKINKYHRGKDTAQSKKYEEESLTGYGIFDSVPTSYNISYLSKLYEINATHFAAVNAKVSNIVGLGYRWVESYESQKVIEDASSKTQRKAIERRLQQNRRMMDRWVEECHQEDTFIETMMKVWIDVEVTGNGYLEVGRTRGGGIGYLGHVPSHTMRVRRLRDGFVQIVQDKVVFFKNFGDRVTSNPLTNDPSPNEIIHFKKYTPSSSFYGIPDVISAINAVAGNEFAEKFNLDYFEHKAVPRYAIIVKGATLSLESERKLIDFFQNSMKGKHHRSVYIPLPETQGKDVEIEFKAIEANIQDASFIKYYEKNRDDILSAHRVPGTKIGLVENVNLAVARDADKMFKEQVVRPMQDIIEKKLNRIIKEKTNMLVFEFEELALSDEDTQSRIDERDLRWGVKVPNEIRAKRGIPKRDGGDMPVDVGSQRIRQMEMQNRQSSEREQNRTGGNDQEGEGRNTQGEGRDRDT